MKPYKVLLPPELADALEREAMMEDRTPAEYLRLIVDRWVFGISRRYAAEMAVPDSLPKRAKRINLRAADRNRLFERDEGRCAYCKGQLLYNDNWHIDHIKPISKGGTNDLTNLVLSCSRCNLEKRDKEVA